MYLELLSREINARKEAWNVLKLEVDLQDVTSDNLNEASDKGSLSSNCHDDIVCKCLFVYYSDVYHL